MNISEVAKMTGLSVKAVRYYDDIGLVKAARLSNGYRDYDQRLVLQLRFLQRSRSLGFTIEDCSSLLSLYANEHRASADVKRLAEDRIVDIEKKIAELQGLKKTLVSLTEACHGDDSPDCPILADLAGQVSQS